MTVTEHILVGILLTVVTGDLALTAWMIRIIFRHEKELALLRMFDTNTEQRCQVHTQQMEGLERGLARTDRNVQMICQNLNIDGYERPPK
jgi:hypothetical protein